MACTKLFIFLLFFVIAFEQNQARIPRMSTKQTAPVHVMEYEVIDNTTSPRNSRFETEIGSLYSVETLSQATTFVLNTLYAGEQKQYWKVTLTVESFIDRGIGSYPLAVASTIENNIRLNSDYLQYYRGDVKTEFTGVLYHESTHIWQWNGNGMAPNGLISGIADYVRLKAGWPSKSWRKRGSGSGWFDGYEVTAYFLDYCNSFRDGFVADLNAMMRESYSDEFFVQLLGKNVYELWEEYKLAYNMLLPSATAPAPAPARY